MSAFAKEFSKLSRAKAIVSILPQRMKMRAAKMLYNYESSEINGIDIVVPMQNDGLVCFINTKELIGWKIFFTGEYEDDTNRILAEHVKVGDVVIEAGANQGSESLLISRLVGNGIVYSFEPNPNIFERLQTNISINSITNVKPFEIALGEQNGTITFNIYPRNFCNPGMSSKYMDTAITIPIAVTQQTLDSFVQEHNISKLNFLKMDIQGAEMDLLVGGRETIKQFKPIIFLEADKSLNDIIALYEELKQNGYTVYKINETGLGKMNAPDEVKPGNWLAKQ